MFVKINGKRRHLWRSVDHEGAGLESFATRTRDKKADPRPGSDLLPNHKGAISKARTGNAAF